MVVIVPLILTDDLKVGSFSCWGFFTRRQHFSVKVNNRWKVLEGKHTKRGKIGAGTKTQKHILKTKLWPRLYLPGTPSLAVNNQLLRKFGYLCLELLRLLLPQNPLNFPKVLVVPHSHSCHITVHFVTHHSEKIIFSFDHLNRSIFSLYITQQGFTETERLVVAKCSGVAGTWWSLIMCQFKYLVILDSIPQRLQVHLTTKKLRGAVVITFDTSSPGGFHFPLPGQCCDVLLPADHCWH